MFTILRDLDKIEEGRAEGFKIGFKEGIELGKEEIVLKMLGRNYSNEEIYTLTGVPIEKIQLLKTQNGI